MQREIKFRGKRLDNGEWVYGYLCEDMNGDFSIQQIVHKVENGWAIPHRNFFSAPDTVGQYTGLKDKNGREIYEGDIISARGIILTVKYIGGVFFACNVDSNIDKYPLYILCEWENESGCEIIGNIHDNPELIKPE